MLHHLLNLLLITHLLFQLRKTRNKRAHHNKKRLPIKSLLKKKIKRKREFW
jgi:hypothetical protein